MRSRVAYHLLTPITPEGLRSSTGGTYVVMGSANGCTAYHLAPQALYCFANLYCIPIFLLYYLVALYPHYPLLGVQGCVAVMGLAVRTPSALPPSVVQQAPITPFGGTGLRSSNGGKEMVMLRRWYAVMGSASSQHYHIQSTRSLPFGPSGYG